MSISRLMAPAFAATVVTLAPNNTRAIAGGEDVCWQHYPLNVSCRSVLALPEIAGNSGLAGQMRNEIQRRLARCTEVEDWETEPENTPLMDLLNPWQVRAKTASCVQPIIDAANAELNTHPRTAQCVVTHTQDRKRPGYTIVEPKCGLETAAFQRMQKGQRSRGR